LDGDEPVGAAAGAGFAGEDELGTDGNVPLVEGAGPPGAVDDGGHEGYAPAGVEPGDVAAGGVAVPEDDESELEYPDSGARLGVG